MKNLLCGVFTVLLVLCFLGPSLAAENEITLISDGGLTLEKGASARDSGSNWVIEAYATSAPAEGEGYNTKAVKSFAAGSSIYLVVRYYIGTPGDVTIYYIVSNTIGTIKYLGTSTTNISSAGNYYGYKVITGGSGYCYFTTVILAQGNNMISETGFTYHLNAE